MVGFLSLEVFQPQQFRLPQRHVDGEYPGSEDAYVLWAHERACAYACVAPVGLSPCHAHDDGVHRGCVDARVPVVCACANDHAVQ